MTPIRRVIFAAALLLPALVSAQGAVAPRMITPFRSGGGGSGSLVGSVDTKGGVILDPSGARDIVIWRAPFTCTVSAVRGYTTGGTSANINARKNGTDSLLSSDLTAVAGAWTSQTTIQNANFAIGDSLEIRLISLSGSPTAVAIQVECTRT